MAGMLLLSGCAAPKPIFPPPDPPIYWPESGDAPRFAYVGRIEGEADLGRQRSFFGWFADLVTGSEAPAVIQSAHGVAVTASRVLYVSDPESHLVHRFDLEGREYRALTHAGEGRAFDTPIGLALSGEDREELLVSDRALGTVTIFSPAGEPRTVIAYGALDGPVGVAVGALTRRIYVVDVPSHQVKVFEPDGRPVFRFGKRGSGPGEFNYPTHVAGDAAETIYVADSLNSRVQVFDREGRFLRSWGQRGDTPGDFSQPKGIACDRAGRVYAVDSHFENVQVFTPAGDLLLAFGREGHAPGEFWLPIGVFVDERDHVWVTDSFNHRVQVFRSLEENAALAEAAAEPGTNVAP